LARSLIVTAGALVLAGVGWSVWLGHDRLSSSTPTTVVSSHEVTLADARQQAILQSNKGKSSDAELAGAYQDINAGHFAGALPATTVIWEARLSEVGPLTARDFTLEGMFGLVGKQPFILLNPALKSDPPKLTRALCHEMVHAYLFSVGDTTSHHGPAFQAVLRRLSAEGAFEGVWASDSDKLGLKTWLGDESARLDSERAGMDQLGTEIERERIEVDRAFADLNARVTAANAQGSGWPSQGEIDAIKSRRDLYNQRAADANARIERDRADLAQFNREVTRYNLMMSYPDGLDESSLVPPKPAMPRPGGG
jgi:hypothetical protein